MLKQLVQKTAPECVARACGIHYGGGRRGNLR
jgi:hypothetical protein